MFKLNKLTPAMAIERLEKNDASLVTCDLSNNAVLQMKGQELIPKLGAALANNTVCQELILSGCGVTDQMCADLAPYLAKNKSLVHLNLQENKVGNDGATALATALAQNRSLMQLNLLNQKGSRFGDATLHSFTDMFDSNVTLLKIIWRLESRQSFRLTKMLTRNNDIDRRIKAGKDYADLLPAKAQPLSPDLIAMRAAASALIGTPRISQMSSGDSGGDSLRESRSFDRSSRASNSLSTREESPPPVAPHLPTAPPPAPPSASLDAAIAALDLEYEHALAQLKADFAAKKAALIKSHS